MNESNSLTIDRDLSRQQARRIRASLGACWYNARTVLRRCPELTGGIYVEGWVCVCPNYIPNEHGWCELNGVIIDPTYYAIDRPLNYFSALRFTAEQIAKVRGHEPLIKQWCGWLKPETNESSAANDRYALAYAQAQAYSKAHYQPPENIK